MVLILRHDGGQEGGAGGPDVRPEREGKHVLRRVAERRVRPSLTGITIHDEKKMVSQC